MGDAKFKAGDVVKLKSGGPPMTLSRSIEIEDSDPDGDAGRTMWFAVWFPSMGGSLEEAKFFSDSIEPTDERLTRTRVGISS